MKRLLSLFLVFCLIFSLCSCTSESDLDSTTAKTISSNLGVSTVYAENIDEVFANIGDVDIVYEEIELLTGELTNTIDGIPIEIVLNQENNISKLVRDYKSSLLSGENIIEDEYIQRFNWYVDELLSNFNDEHEEDTWRRYVSLTNSDLLMKEANIVFYNDSVEVAYSVLINSEISEDSTYYPSIDSLDSFNDELWNFYGFTLKEEVYNDIVNEMKSGIVKENGYVDMRTLMKSCSYTVGDLSFTVLYYKIPMTVHIPNEEKSDEDGIIDENRNQCSFLIMVGLNSDENVTYDFGNKTEESEVETVETVEIEEKEKIEYVDEIEDVQDKGIKDKVEEEIGEDTVLYLIDLYSQETLNEKKLSMLHKKYSNLYYDLIDKSFPNFKKVDINFDTLYDFSSEKEVPTSFYGVDSPIVSEKTSLITEEWGIGVAYEVTLKGISNVKGNIDLEDIKENNLSVEGVNFKKEDLEPILYKLENFLGFTIGEETHEYIFKGMADNFAPGGEYHSRGRVHDCYYAVEYTESIEDINSPTCTLLVVLGRDF